MHNTYYNHYLISGKSMLFKLTLFYPINWIYLFYGVVTNSNSNLSILITNSHFASDISQAHKVWKLLTFNSIQTNMILDKLPHP